MRRGWTSGVPLRIPHRTRMRAHRGRSVSRGRERRRGPGADLGHYGSRSRYFLRAGIAWMTISSPFSRASTTVSSRRAPVSKPRRNSRWGGPSSSRGSIHSDHSAAWIASFDEMPCLSALRWTFTQRRGPARPGSPRTCSCRSWLRGVESVELLGGQPDRHDLHRFSPATRAPTAPTLENVDVVSRFGLVGPLVNLLFARHAYSV